MLMAALHAYNKLLTTHPIRINSMTGTILGALGDFFSQRIDDPQRTDVDWQTCASAAVFGAGMSGVFIPWWYRNLDIWIPGTAFAALAYKSVVDIIFNGGLTNAAAIGARGAPPMEIARAMPLVMLADCVVWGPYNMVAFGRIPLHIRPTTTAFVTLGWNTFLSDRAARGRRAAAESSSSS